jgi:Holliday junction resolvase RusA-like endonuclease
VGEPFYIFVHGQAATKGSPQLGLRKDGSRFMRLDSDALRRWSRTLKSAVGVHLRGRRTPLFRGPVRVTLSFTLVRPKGHRRADGSLKPGAPPFPTARLDLDKLCRAAIDGLVASKKAKAEGDELVLLDDVLVVELLARKVYGAEPGVRIWIEPLAADVAGERAA